MNLSHLPDFTRAALPAAGRAPAFALVATLAVGCSGINASKSISALDFILPGLLQNSLPSPGSPLETNTVLWLAHASCLPR